MNYSDAFSRHKGLFTADEQRRLAASRVAIAGMGGVGGIHLATLARMGVGKFHISDKDSYDASNINRQYGATWKTIGLSKASVMAEIANSINPEAELRIFAENIAPGNVEAFLDGVDVAVDGIDFFGLESKRLFFKRALEKGIPIVTAAPLGFGTTLIVFAPGGMGFDEYFGFRDGMSAMDQAVAFAVGIAPNDWHVRYLDLSQIDPAAGRGPSSGAACALCAGALAAEVAKILLKRGTIEAAPRYMQFDPYLRKFRRGRVWLGARNPRQALRRWVLARWARSRFTSFSAK